MSRLRKLLDRLSKQDPSLTEVVISAASREDDETDDDLDIYAWLANHLPNNRTIQSLSITEEGPCDDSGIPSMAAVLSTLPKLRHISLVRVGLSEEDTDALARALPALTHLQTLNLEGNGIDDDGLVPLCAALGNSGATLRALELRGNNASDAGAKALAEHVFSKSGCCGRHLTSFSVGVSIGKEGVRCLCKSLASHPSLEVFDLSGNKRGGVDLAAAVASILPTLSALTCLKLNHTGIGPRGSKTLLATIAKHKIPLRDLHFAGNRVGFFGAKAIQTIGLLPSVRVLNLGNNAITNDGVWQLTGVVSRLEQLKALDLSSNQLGDDAAAEIARMLPSLSRLGTLDLSGNKDLGDAGAEVLAEALPSVPSLTELVLTYNSIGNVGAAALGTLLAKESCSLVSVDLNGNKVGDEGAVALARGLIANTTLTHLDLGANRIGDEGAGEFVDTMDTNTTLLELNLAQNSISASRTLVLDMLLKHRLPAKPIDETAGEVSESSAGASDGLPHSPRASVGGAAKPEEDLVYDEHILSESRSRVQDASIASKAPSEIPFQFSAYCTEKFHPRNLLNYGSFGDLYEGFDTESGQRYAISRLTLADAGVLGEMRSRTLEDLASLKLANHENVLPLLGYSIEQKAVVQQDIYTFVYGIGTTTTLNELIADFDKRRSMLWPIRIQILKDIVGALDFLHTGCKDKNIRPSFHGDIKSANVFVDDYFRGKLIDCGVSRLVATDRSLFQRGDVVLGTRGYRCPRYERGQKYAKHSDVFSLGIVMSEIIGGRLQGNVDESTGKEQDYYYQYILERKISVDPLGGSINKGAIGTLCHIAMVCMNSEPARRPTTSTLFKTLEKWYM